MQWSLIGITLISAIARAQQPPTPTEAPNSNLSSTLLKVYSQLVVLDTVVRDRHGDAVKHLTRDDFTILEDGVPQPIVAFDAVDATAPVAQKVAIHSTEELEKLEQKSPVTILVLDELTTKFEDEYFARYSLKKYLDTQGDALSEPTMLMARTYNRTMVLQDYTTSKKDVLNALDRHLVGNDWRARDPAQADTLFGAAFASLIEIAKATQGHTGHKNLVWIGRGFPAVQWTSLTADRADALKTTIVSCSNLLRDARITLYSLDPSGIAMSTESTTNSNGDLILSDSSAGQIDFDKIAQSTGGIAMHGRNDVDRMIGQAVLDGEVYYTLSYRPQASSEDDPKKFHQIKVVMKDPQWIATSREGYYSESPRRVENAPLDADLSDARSVDLAGAINGLMVFTGLPIEIVRKGQTSNYEVTFPAKSVDLANTDGRLTGKIDLIVANFDRYGKMVGSSGKVVSLHLPTLPTGANDDRKVKVTISAGDTGHAARLRFVLRAQTNGVVGAENYFLVDRNSLQDPSTGLKAGKH